MSRGACEVLPTSSPCASSLVSEEHSSGWGSSCKQACCRQNCSVQVAGMHSLPTLHSLFGLLRFSVCACSRGQSSCVLSSDLFLSLSCVSLNLRVRVEILTMPLAASIVDGILRTAVEAAKANGAFLACPFWMHASILSVFVGFHGDGLHGTGVVAQ